MDGDAFGWVLVQVGPYGRARWNKLKNSRYQLNKCNVGWPGGGRGANMT